MTENRFVFIILCSLITLPLFGQVSGKIVDIENGEPLIGVIVTAKKIGGDRIIGYKRANNEGEFRLKLESKSGVWLHFSMLGYAKDSVELKAGQSYYEIKLREQTTQLKEVKVTARAITAQGDTIRYLVSNFSEIQDKNLADVLKKMPGIEVSESGQIKYQGQAINKFYIEGRDMLGGRYGIATNTINPDDVGSVEVLENHQPIKALEDLSFSQNPAINIRLKEDAKSRWVGTAKLGGGYMDTHPALLLWDGQATVMRFKKESQALVTARSTNVGKSATSFSSNLIFESDGSPLGGEYTLSAPLSISPSLPYQLDRHRTRKGPSHMVSTNNLWGLGKNIDLTSKINYSHQTDLSKSRSSMIYLLNDGNRVIESEEESEARDQNLSMDLHLLINRPQLYLSNKLSGDFEWDRSELLTAGTYPNSQALRGERQRLENRLNLLIRKGNRNLSIHSFVKWEHTPNRLQVTLPDEALTQTLAAQLLFTNTSTSLSYILGRVVLSTKIGVATMHRSMESQLSGLVQLLSPLNNDLSAHYYQLYATPQLSYSHKGFKSEIEVPMAWTPYSFGKSGESTKLHRFPLSPRIRMDLQASARWKLVATARYRNEILDDQEWYDGYILNNYRTLSLGLEELRNRKSGSASISANYRNALEALFANVAVSYNQFRLSHINSRNFLDRYLLLQPIAQESRGDSWTINGRVSKGFIWWKSIFSLNALYSVGNQELLLQKELTPYHYDRFLLSGQISMRPAPWVSLLYEISYHQSGQAPQGEAVDRRDNYAQRLDLTFIPSKAWRLELTGNHYYNELTKEVRKHYLLADASLVYSAPAGWELNLSARNLFNNRTYSYTSLSTLTSYTAEYQIRPLELLLGFYLRF